VLHDPVSDLVAVVDPGDARVTDDFLQASRLKPDQIWITHHHPDHTGGVSFLKNKYSCKVIASSSDQHRIKHGDCYYLEGDEFSFGDQLVQVLATPGHTLGAVSYYLPGQPMLFCGDTLFSFGCGRMFEGNPCMFWKSLLKIRSLPDETLIYCAHEYTGDNLRFALSITPEDPFLLSCQERVRKIRAGNQPSLPALLKDEKRGNPFLRADSPEVLKALNMTEEPGDVVFGKLRAMKDHF